MIEERLDAFIKMSDLLLQLLYGNSVLSDRFLQVIIMPLQQLQLLAMRENRITGMI